MHNNKIIINIILQTVPTKIIIKLSRGEIFVANFIPLTNGASQGNFFQARIPKMAVFDAKTG